MTIENYLKIEVGKLLTIRFDKAVKQTKPITDPTLGFSKDVTTLDLHVTEVNLVPANTLLSISSVTLQKALEPYLIDEKFLRYRFTLTKEQGAYSPPRIVSAQPMS